MNQGQSEVMETRTPTSVLRGSSEFADTLIDFGGPVLEILSSRPAEGDVREAVELLVSVWNAHALAQPAWGSPDALQELDAIATSADAPHFLKRVLSVLSERRKSRFTDDARVAEEWAISGDGRGYVLSCLPKGPPA
jgi:hypothetical protein